MSPPDVPRNVVLAALEAAAGHGTPVRLARHAGALGELAVPRPQMALQVLLGRQALAADGADERPRVLARVFPGERHGTTC